jgi:hypothetical protein
MPGAAAWSEASICLAFLRVVRTSGGCSLVNPRKQPLSLAFRPLRRSHANLVQFDRDRNHITRCNSAFRLLLETYLAIPAAEIGSSI